MFNKQNFCHIASNNRNDVKAGVFVYKTTDDLATVSVSGYFNEKIVDINLHDLIIHEWHNPNDRTDVQYNLLCVVERTLENVGTVVIESNWQESVDNILGGLDDRFVKKTGDTMTGPLTIKEEVQSSTYSHTLLSLCASYNGSNNPIELSVAPNGSNLYLSGSLVVDSEVLPKPSATSPKRLGGPLSDQHWDCVYTKKIYNGYQIAVPQTNAPDTLALKSEVDLAANSGDQLTSKGVWYAKMYAATVPPAAEDGTNYADFSQVDGNGDPIIVIYERQSGAWVQTDTITPPANYNGYVTVTSKIWDIPEQSGQQGGKVLWSHNQKTFTPYPQIISFEDAALTGNSTVAMPLNPTNDNIANKGYVDSAIASALPAATTWDLFDFKWKDCTMSRPGWALSDGNWINKADAETAYQHFIDEINPNISYCRWDSANSTHIYTRYVDPAVGDEAFTDTSLSISAGTIESIGVGYITIGGINYDYKGYFGWTAQYDTTPGGLALYYHVASDGHKITAPDPIVDTMYSETGVAWYYVVDIANQRFKLPRENPSKELIIASKARIAVTETGHVPGYTTWVPTISASTPADGTDQRALYQQAGAGYSNLTNTKYADGTTASPDFVFNDTIADIDTARTGYAGKQYLYFYIGI